MNAMHTTSRLIWRLLRLRLLLSLPLLLVNTMGKPKKENKPKQMPSHVGLFQKLKQRTQKTNQPIEFMRGNKGNQLIVRSVNRRRMTA